MADLFEDAPLLTAGGKDKKQWIDLSDKNCALTSRELKDLSDKEIAKQSRVKFPVKSVEVPEAVFIVGTPGSGKSTYLEQEYKNRNYISIDIDEIFMNLEDVKRIVDQGVIPNSFISSCPTISRIIVSNLFEFAVSNRYNLVYDYPIPIAHRMYEAAIAGYKVKMIVVHHELYESRATSRLEETGRKVGDFPQLMERIRERIVAYGILPDEIWYKFNDEPLKQLSDITRTSLIELAKKIK